MRLFKTRFWTRFKAIFLPFFQSAQRWRALARVGVLVALLLSINGMNVLNSYTTRDFMTDLAIRDFDGFYVHAAMLVGIFAASTVVEVLSSYTQQRLGLFWREWLTRHILDRYFAGRAYRRLAVRGDIDNPDQRISDDIKTFTSTTLGFLVLLFNATLTFAAFAGILWTITPWLLFAAVVYATFGSLGTILIGWRLVALDNKQLQKEADFRFRLARFRDQSGVVAQLGGEEEEKTRLTGRLSILVENFAAIIRVSRNLGFFTTAYNYLPQIIPIAIVAPLYIRGKVEFGTVPQAAMAFSQVLAAFSLIISQFQQISTFAAVVGRLGSMWEATAKEHPPWEEAPAEVEVPVAAAPAREVVEIVPGAQSILYENVTLRTPKGRLLVRDLSLEVPRGTRLVITGPHGTGKTALILAAAGLWEETEGKIYRPEDAQVMFLPQTPYIVPGRLQDVLLYGLDHQVPADRLHEVLRELDLETTVSQVGNLDADRDWPTVLSEGEKEALEFARLMLANPSFAFLDNVAGFLETSWLERLYGALDRGDMTYISAGNHLSLLDFHDLRLELFGNGEWRLGPCQAASRRNGKPRYQEKQTSA